MSEEIFKWASLPSGIVGLISSKCIIEKERISISIRTISAISILNKHWNQNVSIPLLCDKVNLRNVYNDSIPKIKKWFQCDNVKTLELTFKEFDINTFIMIKDSFPNIEKIKFKINGEIKSYIFDIISDMKTLKSIALFGDFTAFSVYNILGFRFLPHLCHVSISYFKSGISFSNPCLRLNVMYVMSRPYNQNAFEDIDSFINMLHDQNPKIVKFTWKNIYLNTKELYENV
jgi:hypothetical protein